MPATTEQRRAVSVLLELTRVLVGGAGLERALRAVTDAALELLPAEHASIRVFDEGRLHLLGAARSGRGTAERPMSMSRGEGVVGWVAEHGEAARISDVSRDPRFKQSEAAQGFAIASMLAVPLVSAGQLIGVLGVTSPTAGVFDEQDELLARLLANCAVPAIDRARLERLAITDPHTRAFNRRILLPRLRQEIRTARRYGVPLSMLLMDLDDFKSVNDEHGHAVGDLVLSAYADRVRAAVRETDVLVRRGGDEFVLIMPHTDESQALTVAERIRAALAGEPLDGGALGLRRTLSIGVASWCGHEGAKELELHADQAMYEAKRRGGDCVVSAGSQARRPPGAAEGGREA